MKTVKVLSSEKDQLDALQHEWEEKYNNDISGIQQQYNALMKDPEQDKSKLQYYQQRYNSNKEEKISSITEREKRYEKEIYDSGTQRLHSIYANRIRFYWRVYWRSRSKELAKARRKRLAAARARKAALKKNPYLARMQERERLEKLAAKQAAEAATSGSTNTQHPATAT